MLPPSQTGDRDRKSHKASPLLARLKSMSPGGHLHLKLSANVLISSRILQHLQFDSRKVLQTTWEIKPGNCLPIFKAATSFPQDHAIVFHRFL